MGKVLDRKSLRGLCRDLRSDKKTIVFTNGCFDLLHAGHVRYLKQAKRLGDVLIVGLNSDSSVSGIKPGRPVIPERQRAEVLAALSFVDYVVIFREKTPLRLIRAVRPDVLVKGGDWSVEDIVGSDIARKTLTIPYIRGLSTTSIIRRIILRHRDEWTS